MINWSLFTFKSVIQIKECADSRFSYFKIIWIFPRVKRGVNSLRVNLPNTFIQAWFAYVSFFWINQLFLWAHVKVSIKIFYFWSNNHNSENRKNRIFWRYLLISRAILFDLASFLTRFEFSSWYIQLVCDQIKLGLD